MLALDPVSAAAKAIQLARKNQHIPLEEGELGDMVREALIEGLPAWVVQKQGFLYLAGNASWPGLYKIGCTRRTVAQRLASLSGAGMATPWVALASWKVPDAYGLEALAHQACAPYCVKGELFYLEPALLREAIESVLAAEAVRWRTYLGPVLGSPALDILCPPPH